MKNHIDRREALKLVAGTAAGLLFAPGAACARGVAGVTPELVEVIRNLPKLGGRQR